MRRLSVLMAFAVLLSGLNFAAADAADPQQLAQSTIDKSLAYLKSKQKPDSGWQDEADPPGITALVLRVPQPMINIMPNQPFLAKGFEKLLSYQVENGGIYKEVLACYNTAIAISALAESKDAEYRGAMLKALDFLRSQQWSDKIAGVPDEMRVKNEHDLRYGGFGYGSSAQAGFEQYANGAGCAARCGAEAG